jgi:hypothetical protein
MADTAKPQVARPADDVYCWLEASSSVMLKAATPIGDPAVLTADEARGTAEALLHLADWLEPAPAEPASSSAKKPVMKNFQELLSHICVRPQMYTPRGDFCDIVSFVSGFASGLQPEARYLEGELNSFSAWMSAKFGLIARNWVWWNVLLYGCGNDESRAIAQLPLLYAEFVAARCPEAL